MFLANRKVPYLRTSYFPCWREKNIWTGTPKGRLGVSTSTTSNAQTHTAPARYKYEAPFVSCFSLLLLFQLFLGKKATVYHLSKMQAQVPLILLLLKGKIPFIPDQRFDHGDPYPEPKLKMRSTSLSCSFCVLAFLKIFLFRFSSYTSRLVPTEVPKQFQESFISQKNISIISCGNLTCSKYAQSEPSCNVCVV